MFTKVYDTAQQNGKAVGVKFNLSNCLIKKVRINASDNEQLHTRGGYDVYKEGFAACDSFNRAMHDRRWPYRCGGGCRTGEEKHMHNFAMTCILQNTFNAYQDIREIPLQERVSFKAMCNQLADELWEKALSMTIDD